jgi:hypothetical protein
MADSLYYPSDDAIRDIAALIDNREKQLSSLPTLAAPEDLQAALRALQTRTDNAGDNSTTFHLPEDGLGADRALEYIRKTVVPALAPGHAGPR